MAKDLYVPAKTETPQIAKDLFSSVKAVPYGSMTRAQKKCCLVLMTAWGQTLCMDVHV